MNELRKAWDEIAASYPEDAGSSRFFDDFYSQHADALKGSAIDVGCGKGRHMLYLAGKMSFVIGIDISENMIDGARRLIASRGFRNVKLAYGFSNELPTGSDMFDFGIAVGSIHHNTWNKIVESFNEMYRVLRPGGLFLFQGRSIHDTSCERKRVDDKGYTAIDATGEKDRVAQHYFTEGELSELARSRFSIVMGPKEYATPEERGQRARLWVVYRKCRHQ